VTTGNLRCSDLADKDARAAKAIGVKGTQEFTSETRRKERYSSSEEEIVCVTDIEVIVRDEL